jgi:ABC-type transport system involved in Fe-S cluster assembly fused permease/ATPase subunit
VFLARYHRSPPFEIVVGERGTVVTVGRHAELLARSSPASN